MSLPLKTKQHLSRAKTCFKQNIMNYPCVHFASFEYKICRCTSFFIHKRKKLFIQMGLNWKNVVHLQLTQPVQSQNLSLATGGQRSGQVEDIDGIGAEKTSCKVGFGKGVYERYYSVGSNFAHLKPYTEVMQRNVCVGDLYPCWCYS